jgi:outer membrane receptor protein involved in Fe transport
MARLHVPTDRLAVLTVAVVGRVARRRAATAISARGYGDSVQLGFDIIPSHRRVRFGMNALYNDVRDLIESVSLGFVATPAQLAALLAQERLDPSYRPVLGRLLFTHKNVSNVVTRGIEADGEVALVRGASAAFAYTYLDARDAERDIALTGRHRHQGHGRVSWRSERVGLRGSLRATFYSSWIAARGTTDVTAPAFALWDASVSQRLLPGLSALLAIDNITGNQDPKTGALLPDGSPAPIYRPEIGRTVRLGVRWTWSRR